MKKLLEKLKYIDPFYYVDEFLMPKINPNENSFVSYAVYFITALITAFVLYNLIGFLMGTSAPFTVVVSHSMVPELHRGDIMILQGSSPENIRTSEVELNELLEFKSFDDFAVAICFNSKERIEEPCSESRKKASAGLLKTNEFNTMKVEFSNGKTIQVDKKGDIIVYFLQEKGIPVIHRAVAKIKTPEGIYFLTKGDSEFNSLIDQDKSLSLKALNSQHIIGKGLFKIPLLGYIKLLLIDDIQVLLFGCPYEECIIP